MDCTSTEFKYRKLLIGATEKSGIAVVPPIEVLPGSKEVLDRQRKLEKSGTHVGEYQVKGVWALL